jgi:hypothetical protein
LPARYRRRLDEYREGLGKVKFLNDGLVGMFDLMIRVNG